jgi:cytidylate kinase
MIITISRETGSGGHTIGKMLAERLGYDFYDKELIPLVAKKMHLDEETILENGENMSDKTYLDMASGFIPFSRKEKVPVDQIQETQNKLIKAIAKKGNCIIVGRGADYILSDREDAFHVFIHANMEHRIARVQRHDRITGEDNRIRRELEVKDHSRGMLYQFFTGREWGRVSNYHLSIDTSVFTKTQAMEIILNAIEKYNGGKNNA